MKYLAVVATSSNLEAAVDIRTLPRERSLSSNEKHRWCSALSEFGNQAEWHYVFDQFPDFAKQVIKYQHNNVDDGSFLRFHGACRFHNHSDVCGYRFSYNPKCRYDSNACCVRYMEAASDPTSNFPGPTNLTGAIIARVHHC